MSYFDDFEMGRLLGRSYLIYKFITFSVYYTLFLLKFEFPCADSSCSAIKVHPHFYYFPISRLIGNSITFAVNLCQCFLPSTLNSKT